MEEFATIETHNLKTYFVDEGNSALFAGILNDSGLTHESVLAKFRKEFIYSYRQAFGLNMDAVGVDVNWSKLASDEEEFQGIYMEMIPYYNSLKDIKGTIEREIKGWRNSAGIQKLYDRFFIESEYHSHIAFEELNQTGVFEVLIEFKSHYFYFHTY